ncbi:MAG TPA: hypothetical protein VFX38_07175, partial [Gammaproteobacteria bacterium]|nr:hypothetical protein [Gammaproteobacteria bacterium]
FHASDGTLDSNEATITITVALACPDGYVGFAGSLPGGAQRAVTRYQAPAGPQNAILSAAPGIRLGLIYQSPSGQSRTFVFPTPVVHRWGPAGSYTWGVEAGSNGGPYALCLMHP